MGDEITSKSNNLSGGGQKTKIKDTKPQRKKKKNGKKKKKPTGEAKSLVEKKVSLPAYDQCLKASHVFNILDARGAISVAQRAEYIGRIRDITKAAAGIWLDTQN